jgi:thiol-disulfide isomerase/thioredoxin
MFKTFGPLLAAAAVPLVSLSFACRREAPLKVGSKAPAIQVSRWVKGNGPSSFEVGRVYVVEFWATWCLPCRDSIPRLTEMARAHGDRVTFVGVSVWEREPEEAVDAFVRDMGDRMDYFVARDTASGHMAKAWLEAAGQDGIPSAFIVDGAGEIAWIGHPMDSMEKAIRGVLSKAGK